MDLNRIPLFSLLAQKMNWLGERQKVLAQNVANADTPGYAPRDLAAFDFKAAAHAAGMKRGAAAGRIAAAGTDPRHLAAGGASAGPATVKAKPGETTLSGNHVSVDSELMKSADTAMDYQLVAGLYRKQLQMLRAVLSRGS
jgi:flagellar basal-body rod protein FlgB